MSEYRNTAATARGVAAYLNSAGVDIDQLFSLAGIRQEDIEDIDSEVTLIQMRDFWKHAIHLSGDSYLAMHVIEALPIGTYKCLDYFFLNAPTLGEAIEKFARYFAVINTWMIAEIIHGPDEAIFRYHPATGELMQPAVEITWAMFTDRARRVFGGDWAPKRISFPSSETTPTGMHQSYFRCPVEYDSPTSDFVLSAEAWEQPPSNADDNLFQLMEKHASLLLEKRVVPGDSIGEVRQAIAHELHDGNPRREAVARRLGIGPRTLQRRLANHNVVYSDLLNEVRITMAKNHLQGNELAMCEIGFLLGFSEQSSFNRAFKRWTGKTPSEFRKDHR